jgi:hypothetical protein
MRERNIRDPMLATTPASSPPSEGGRADRGRRPSGTAHRQVIVDAALVDCSCTGPIFQAKSRKNADPDPVTRPRGGRIFERAHPEFQTSQIAIDLQSRILEFWNRES